MSRPHFVKSAAKDYPHAGIKKGDPYWWWKPYRMAKQMSKTMPKRSQTAGSDYARNVLSAVEALEAWEGEWGEDDRNDLVSQLEGYRDEEQEKFDNLPEGFQQGDTGMLIEERVAALDAWIMELEGIDFEEVDPDETPLEKALSTAADA